MVLVLMYQESEAAQIPRTAEDESVDEAPVSSETLLVSVPEGPKYPNMGAFGASVLGIIIIAGSGEISCIFVLGRLGCELDTDL